VNLEEIYRRKQMEDSRFKTKHLNVDFEGFIWWWWIKCDT